MFDRVYPDLMTLFKSTELNQSALDMNTQYEVLLEFFNVHKHTPKYTPRLRIIGIQSEPPLYDAASKLNHRLTKEIHQDSDRFLLLPAIIEAAKAILLQM